MASAKYIAKRVANLLATFFVVICLNFAIPRIIPESPASVLASNARLPEVVAKQLVIRFGLNQPLPIQFEKYLIGIFSWPPNLGVSYAFYPRTVLSLILSRLPWTLFLVGSAVFISWVIGTSLGIISAMKQRSFFDNSTLVSGIIIYTFPAFWIGLFLLWFLGVDLGLFPVFGAYSYSSTGTVSFLYSVLSHSALPITALVLANFSAYFLLMRNNMIHMKAEDFILTEKAKGVSDFQIVLRHMSRNAMLPVVSLLGINLGLAVSGAIGVEIVFSYPGLGYLIYQAVVAHDYPLIQGTFLFIAISVILMNFLTDIIYGYIDPRARL